MKSPFTSAEDSLWTANLEVWAQNMMEMEPPFERREEEEHLSAKYFSAWAYRIQTHSLAQLRINSFWDAVFEWKMQFCLGRKLYLCKTAKGENVPRLSAPSWSKRSNRSRPFEVEEFVSYPVLTPAGSRWRKDRTNAVGQSCWFNFYLSPSILFNAEPITFDTSHEDAALLFSGSASMHYPSKASWAVTKSFLVLALIPTLSILPSNLRVALFILLCWPPALQILLHSPSRKARD